MNDAEKNIDDLVNELPEWLQDLLCVPPDFLPEIKVFMEEYIKTGAQIKSLQKEVRELRHNLGIQELPGFKDDNLCDKYKSTVQAAVTLGRVLGVSNKQK